MNKNYPCNPTNYQQGRQDDIKFIVIHYVGGTGSAKQNAQYFNGSKNLQASANFFVGHKSENAEVYQSVDPKNTAWHCGAEVYKHPTCRNYNSIGIEMCCHKKLFSKWYFDKETVDKTVVLVKDLMKTYKVPIGNVIRHYDVTGKDCPAPFVADKKAWLEFKTRLTKSSASSVKKDDIRTVTLNGLPVRTKPSFLSKTITKYPKGSIIIVEAEKGLWAKTNLGWVKSKYLKKKG